MSRQSADMPERVLAANQGLTDPRARSRLRNRKLLEGKLATPEAFAGRLKEHRLTP
jgi:hypothetical protein